MAFIKVVYKRRCKSAKEEHDAVFIRYRYWYIWDKDNLNGYNREINLPDSSSIPLDENMEAVRPCMIWMDRRADEETRWVLENIGEDKLYEITHNGADPYYGYTKILWMKNHEPENWAKTKLFLPPNDYVIYKLTGEVAIDYSSAGNLGGVFNMNKCEWSEELLDAMGIPMLMMPERIVESTDIVGGMTKEVTAIGTSMWSTDL